MTIEEEIRQVLGQAKAEIQANMAAKNINASGRTSAAFAVVETPDDISLVLQAGQHAPLATLEIGRPGGNVPGGFRMTKKGIVDVSNKFKWLLILWARDKGFDLGWGGATMLGRRIAAEGTLRNKAHVDVYSTPVHKAVAELDRIIPRHILGQINEIVKTNF